MKRQKNNINNLSFKKCIGVWAKIDEYMKIQNIWKNLALTSIILLGVEIDEDYIWT